MPTSKLSRAAAQQGERRARSSGVAVAAAAILLTCAPTGTNGPDGTAPEAPSDAPPAAVNGDAAMPDAPTARGADATPAGGETLATSEPGATVVGERATLEMAVPEAFPEAVAGGERLGLVMAGVDFGRPGIYYEVYAGLPAGAAADPAGPYYAGTLSSFGPAGDQTQVSFDITRLVAALQAEGRWTGTLELTFVRRGLEPPADQPDLETIPEEPGPVRIETLSLVRYDG